MHHNNRLDKNISDVVPIIRILLELYHQSENDDKKSVRSWVDFVLHWAIRRLEIFVPKTLVSKNAAELAKKDISTYTWDDQTVKSKMNDPNRKKFHYEHIVPVSQLRRELEALDPISDEAIFNLISQVDIAWITKSECKMLGSHGKKTDSTSHTDNIFNLIEFI